MSERNKTVLIICAASVFLGLGILALLSGERVSITDILSTLAGGASGGFLGVLLNRIMTKRSENGSDSE